MKIKIYNIFCFILFFSFTIGCGLFVAENICYAQDDIVITANTTWPAGEYTYNNVSVTNGATLIFNGKVTLNASNLTIDSGSFISADGTGYPAMQGPGAGITGVYTYGGGGGYGGKGGSSYFNVPGGNTYGSLSEPSDLGSGGGSSIGGAGGGAVKLIVAETLTLNGVISSNGTDGRLRAYYGGGGSGGSVYIAANNITGNGIVSANGGKGSTIWTTTDYLSGGGGGGRIAFYYNSNNFQGSIKAFGGAGYGQYGAAGTIFIKSPNQQYGNLIIDNNNNPGAITQLLETQYNFDSLKIINKASAILPGNIVCPEIILRDWAVLDTSNNLIRVISDSISIETNSKLQGNLDITTNNLTIDSTSFLSADAKGYPATQGPGTGATGVFGYAGGGGYGGKGSNGYHNVSGGTTYGSASEPLYLGSGGGSLTAGGSGGGMLKLAITETLILNGVISSGGLDGRLRAFYGGGGSGGSVYIAANNITGSGIVSTNGGNGSTTWTTSDYTAGAGGGGRIALYYGTNNFAGKLESKGGKGYSGPAEDGTVVFGGSSLDVPFSAFTLFEKSSNISTLLETVSAQKIGLNNITATGGLNGTFNFNNFEIVKIATGSFLGKGFFKSSFNAILESSSYNGICNGVIYPVISEKKIYLKGEISGDLSGTMEGYLTETIPDSGVYDHFQAIGNINRLNKEVVSVAIDLQGNLSYQPEYNFVTELYFYQANMQGSAYGFYTGPLSAVVTHLRVSGENQYKGQGFSFISYNSSLGQGESFAFNQSSLSQQAEFDGLFTAPILGKLSASLIESDTPKKLNGIIERLDVGAEPMADLEAVTWGPQRVSPGQTIDYLIEVRNDGLKNAENTTVIFSLDPKLEYLSSTYSYFDEETKELFMDLGTLESKGSKIIRVTAKVPWGLAAHTPLGNECRLVTTTPEKNLSTVDTTSWRDNIQPGDIILEHNEKSIVGKTGYWTHSGGIVYGTKDDSWTGGKDGYFVIEPLAGDKYHNNQGGVKVTPVESWDYPFKKEVVVLRREGLLQQQKDYISNFWIKQIGKPYQNPLFGPSIDANEDAGEWYCSELIWAPYHNLNIEFNTSKWDVGDIERISPAEIYDSNFILPVPGAYYNHSNLTVNIRTTSSEVITANDPNELLVSPEGNVKPGDTLNYTINYENEGEGIAFGVYVTDVLEEDLDASTLNLGGNGSYDAPTRTIAWIIGELGSKQKGSVSFSVKVKEDAPDKSEVINFATIYFPSVPQATRTNGTVNLITTYIDNVAPASTLSVSPLANPAGWNNADIAINLTATDNEGGCGVKEIHYKLTGAVTDEKTVLENTAQITVSSEGVTTLAYWSVDNLGNIESQKSAEIKIDKTLPLATAQALPQANTNGWNNTDVAVSFTANDSLSGIATVTTPVSVTGEGVNQYIAGEAFDLAGNKTTTNIAVNIDKTQPEVTINAPIEEAEYILNTPVFANWSANDVLSGIVSVTATVSNGSLIDTASPGTKAFSVVATDNAGNVTEKLLTYYARYSYSGVSQPVNQDGSSIFKLGRVVPVKFQLKDGNGKYISTAIAKIYLSKINNDVQGSEIEAESIGEANTGNVFRYDNIDNQYIFNLGTKSLSAGTWQIRISLDDGSSKYVAVSLK